MYFVWYCIMLWIRLIPFESDFIHLNKRTFEKKTIPRTDLTIAGSELSIDLYLSSGIPFLGTSVEW